MTGVKVPRLEPGNQDRLEPENQEAGGWKRIADASLRILNRFDQGFDVARREGALSVTPPRILI